MAIPEKVSSDLATVLSVARQRIGPGSDENFHLGTHPISLGRRANAMNLIASLALVIAPIHQLPSEILALIFVEAAQPTSWQSDAEWHTHTSSFACALRLSQVCSTWRQVALRTTLLWRVALPLTKKHSSAMLREFLQRAGAGLVPMDFPKGLPKSTLTTMLEVLPRAAALSVRCKDILNRMLGDNCPVLTNLHTLSVTVTCGPHESRTAAFITAETLATVTLNGPLLPMPWSRLEDLTLHTPTVHAREVLQALTQCTRVVHLNVIMQAWRVETTPRTDAHILAYLQSFKLHFKAVGGLHFDTMFWSLRLPSLCSFTLELENNFESWQASTQAEFTLFLLGSPHLENLGLRACKLTATDIHGMLICVPKLQQVNLQSCSGAAFTSRLVECLTYDAANPAPTLVPLLHTLTADNIFGGDDGLEDDEKLWAMIDSRASPASGPFPITPLRKIHLQFDDGWMEINDPLSPAVRARIAVLKSRGLDILIFG
uniref:F-box domain-containing protein n=1 Tax=Mycena chlorophos TaxID=658473 RepID=A0ABQ0KX61_MYCCL|nr:predicted protein [Mycena chlorophos]